MTDCRYLRNQPRPTLNPTLRTGPPFGTGARPGETGPVQENLSGKLVVPIWAPGPPPEKMVRVGFGGV